MIHLGVQCMYFRAKPLQNQCILGLVHYTKQTVYLESYFDLNTLKMIVKIKFDVNYVKLNLIRTFNFKNTLHQLMGNETSLAQKTKIEQSFYTFLEIVYLEVSKELKRQCILEIFVPKPKQCICENSVPWGRVPWGLAVIFLIDILTDDQNLNCRIIVQNQQRKIMICPQIDLKHLQCTLYLKSMI